MPTNTVFQGQQYAVLASDYLSVQYQDTDGSWIDIPGVTDYDMGATDRPRRDLVSMNTDPMARFGRPRVSSITIQAQGIPQSLAWRRMVTAARDGEVLSFRVETNGIRRFTAATTNPATASVAQTTGVVSFNHGASNGQRKPEVNKAQGIGIGAMLQIGTGSSFTYAMISSIEDGPVIKAVEAATFKYPTATLTAAAVNIWSPPPMRFEFTGEVSGAAGLSFAAESDAETTLTIAPSGHVPLPIFLALNSSGKAVTP